jgi:hypothetical protein
MTDISKDKKPPIDFPPCGDDTWKKIDEELQIALPLVFSDEIIRSTPIATLSSKFDSWLYSFFEERFGLTPAKTSRITKKRFRHRGLERLRRRKTELRRSYRTLLHNGQQDSPAAELIRKEYKNVMRVHNRLRIAIAREQAKRAESAACKKFRKNPNLFAKALFKNSTSAAPTFAQEKAKEYFSRTYRDNERGSAFSALEGLQRPQLPSFLFNCRPPSIRELSRSVRKKSNSACPGLNSLTYVPYKKCPVLIRFLHKFVSKIWREKTVPDDWAQAFIVLLSKDLNKLDDPSCFRPIAITNTVGKIFFSVISDRLQQFMIKNRFIDRSYQKGFLSGVAGCLEHSFTLFEALREAKLEKRQIVVAWIDLANAYGSVRHNLIQFALHWFHVPTFIQSLIFDYYNKLMANVFTKDWSTGFFMFDIGLFQGCVLSTILFDCVFQLLLDFLRPLETGGFEFNSVEVRMLSRAYADDLALSARNPTLLQSACDKVQEFLSWSVTMKAKPKKCVAVGFRQFDPRSDSGKYTALTRTKYSAYDPRISIAGHQMRFMVDLGVSSSSLAHDHFKFLGRWIHVSLSEEKVKMFVKSALLKDVEKVDKSGVNGLMKLWLYQFYLLARLSWPFLVHDFCHSFAVELQDLIKTKLKKWALLYKGADLGSLFRSRETAGLGLTSIVYHFEKMQIIKCSILNKSQDTNVQLVYKSRSSQTLLWRKKWSAAQSLNTASEAATLKLRFPANINRRGLGHGDFVRNPSRAQFRNLVTEALKSEEQNRIAAHSHCLARQGVWTTWLERTVPFDLSWKNLLYSASPKLIGFVLNSTINSVRTPDMLKLWGYKKSDHCALCGKSPGTLHHIIASCQVSLIQGRYTWRHDSVLFHLKRVFEALLQSSNSKPVLPDLIPHISSSFVRAGESKILQKRSRRSILKGANDWELLVDVHRKLVFPVEIYATDQRPDILILSRSLKKVLLIELTCPAEEGILTAQARKRERYEHLVSAINDDPRNPWSATLFTVESGARGFVGKSISRLLRLLGLPARQVRKECRSISDITAKCTFEIFLAKDSMYWDKRRALVPSICDPAQNLKELEVVVHPRPVSSPRPAYTLNAVDFLKHKGVRHLYHFTNRSNLVSIMRLGLRSWKFIEENGGIDSTQGGSAISRALDEKKGLERFVRLSFSRKHPMMFACQRDGRVPDPVVLQFSVDVASLPGTKFSNKNATANDVKISDHPAMIRFDIVQLPSSFAAPKEFRPFFQAEVLIKDQISPDHIVNVLSA